MEAAPNAVPVPRQPLKLLLLLDKKPGHSNQTEGVAKAVERATPVAAVRLAIRQRPFIHLGMMRLAMKAGPAPASGLWAFYGIRLSDISKPDGIIASGRSTIAAAILLARHFRVPLIYSGRITGYDTRDVTLQLVGKSRSDDGPGIALVPKPTAVEADRLPPPKSLSGLSDLAGANLALLVGGDSNNHSYTDREWDQLGAFLKASAAELSIRWHVSTSRRSPDYAGDVLAGIARSGGIADFIDYRLAGPGSAAHLFGLDAIVVTQDSRTMIAEAIAAWRPVIVLRPDGAAPDGLGESLSAEERQGTFAVLRIAELEPTSFAKALLGLSARPMPSPQEAVLAAVAPAFGLSAPTDASRPS